MPAIAANQARDPFEAFTKALTASNAPLDQFNRTFEALTLKLIDAQRPTDALGRSIDDLSAKMNRAAPGSDTSNRFENFGKHLRGIGSALSGGNLLFGMSRMGGAIASLGGPMTKLTGAALAAPAAITQMGIAMERFVAKANPAAAFQFNRALDDLNATMGQILLPVFQGITQFIRMFADGLQGLRPAFEPIMKGIGDTIAALGPVAQSLMQLMGPALQSVGYIVTEFVVPAIKTLADSLTDFVKYIMEAVKELTQGAIDFDEFKAKSSVGAAVRPAAYGKIEDIGKRTTLAALNQSSTDPAKDTAKNTAKTNDLLTKLLERIGVDKNTAAQASDIGKRARNATLTFGISEIRNVLRDL